MKTGIFYAMAEDGAYIPVIDVSNPAFALTTTDAELDVMAEKYVTEFAQMQEIPAQLREALQHSVLGRALIASSGAYVSGMNTYMMKLGPVYWNANANTIDRGIAGSFPAFAARLRLQDMANLLAEGLSRGPVSTPGRPICLINIGGGTAADSWNALIQLSAAQANLLVQREIVIAVLDIDDCGAGFGARAIETLCAAGAPLDGLDVRFRHFHYDWTKNVRLSEILDELHADEAVCAVSSEGGLFEYGSEAEITSNLEAIRRGTSFDVIIVGSVTRDDGASRATQMGTRISTQPRAIESFRALAAQTGWIVEEMIRRPLSYNIRMVKNL